MPRKTEKGRVVDVEEVRLAKFLVSEKKNILARVEADYFHKFEPPPPERVEGAAKWDRTIGAWHVSFPAVNELLQDQRRKTCICGDPGRSTGKRLYYKDGGAFATGANPTAGHCCPHHTMPKLRGAHLSCEPTGLECHGLVRITHSGTGEVVTGELPAAAGSLLVCGGPIAEARSSPLCEQCRVRSRSAARLP